MGHSDKNDDKNKAIRSGLWHDTDVFAESIVSLNMLIDSAVPAVVGRAAKKRYESYIRALKQSDSPHAKEILELFDEVEKSTRTGIESTGNLDFLDETLLSRSEERIQEILATDRASKKPQLSAFSVAYRRGSKATDSETLLLNSVVVSAVSALETILAASARSIVTAHPERTSENREFSITDLLEYDSLDALIERSIQKRIDTLLRGGLESWEKWFREKSGERISLPSYVSQWVEIVEIYKRRNAIVHTAGTVNSDYAGSVPGSPDVGKLLEISADYTHRTLERLATLGMMVAISVYQKLQASMFLKSERIQKWEAMAWVIAERFEHEHLFDASVSIYSRLERDTKPRRNQNEVSRYVFDRWRCYHASGQSDQIKQESAKILEHELATMDKIGVLIYSGEYEDGYELFESSVAQGWIKVADIPRIGLYEKLRNDPRVRALTD